MDGKSTKKVYVGIDFGACNLKAQKFDGKIRKIGLNKKSGGGDEAPNVIYYGKTRENVLDIKFGDAAKKNSDYENKILHVKRHLGEAEWHQHIPNLAKDVNAFEAAKDIFSLVWNEIARKSAQREEYEAIVTVPVNWPSVERQRIKDAAIAAGIPLRGEVITEPFAALFSLEEILDEEDEQIVLIFDFGGSTLDLSLLQVEGGDAPVVRELSAVGMSYGGLAIDEAIYEELLWKKYKEEMEVIKAGDDLGSVRKELLEMIAAMKESLFDGDDDEITDMYTDRHQGKDWEFTITRDEVVAMLEAQGIRGRITNLLEDLLDVAEPGMRQAVTKVAPFGGTSRIPFFQEILREYFGEDIFNPERDFVAEDIYLAVAGGAAKYLAWKQEGGAEIESIIPFNIGLAQGNKFKRYLKRGERCGFETAYKALTMEDLREKAFRLDFYQTFSNREEAPLSGDDSAIYMGSVKLTEELYTALDAISFKLSITKNGHLRVRFYENRMEGEETEIVLVEEKLLAL